MTDAYCNAQKPKTQSCKMGRDEIIKRCIERHGTELFDYSGIAEDANGALCKIDIKCKTCQTVFRPTASAHYNIGTGCPNCKREAGAKKRRKGYDGFVTSAREAHGTEYEYPKQKIDGTRGYAKIICKTHGLFQQSIQSHLKGSGCHECGKEKAAALLKIRNAEIKFTSEDFERESRKIYGDLLGYDRESFTNTREDVRLKCKTHGWFVVNAHAHLYGQNKRKQKKGVRPAHPCSHCRQDEINKQKAAREEAKHVQRKKRLEELRKEQRLREFLRALSVETEEEKAARLAKSRERRRKRSEKSFIDRAAKIHKGQYIYDPEVLDFKTADGYVNVICKTHGVFRQKIKSHIERQRGCPECGALKGSGWTRSSYIDFCNGSSDGKSNLYVIKCQKGNEEFLKVGIAAYGVERRFKTDMPYDYAILYEIKADAGYIYDLEKRLHRILRKKEKRYTPKIPFGGYTECFNTIKPIEPLLKELAATEQIQLIA